MADKSLYNLLIDLRANTANLQSDMDKAANILERSTGKMQTVMRGFFLGLGATIGNELLSSVGRLSGALSDLADKGELFGSIAEQFKRLGGSTSSIDAARKAVLGTVSAFDLMKVANEGIIKGIPNLNQNFAKLSEYAGRFADATGRDTLEVLESLTNAIAKGSNKALLEFGIQVDQSGTKAERMAQALDQLGKNMGQFAEFTDSVSNAHVAFKVAIDDAMKSVGVGINNSEELAKVYRDLADAVHAIDWQQVGTDVASMVASVASVLPSLQGVADKIAQIAQTIRALTGNDTNVDRLNVAGSQYQSEIADLQKQIDLRKRGVGNTALAGGKVGQLIDSTFGTEVSGYNPAVTADMERQLASKKEYLELAKKELAFARQQEELKGTNLGLLPANPAQAGMRFQNGRWVDAQAAFGGGSGGGRGGASSAAADKAIERQLEKEKQAEEKLADEKQKQTAALLQNEYAARKKMEDDLAKQRQDSVQQFTGAFQDLFSSLGLDSGLAKAASDFASQIAGGLVSTLKDNQGGLFGIGHTIADGVGQGISALFGGGSAGVDISNYNGDSSGKTAADGKGLAGMFDSAQSSLGGGGDTSGDGMTTAQAHESGIQGPGAQDGSFNGGGQSQGGGYGGYVVAGATVADASMHARERDRANQDNRGTGAAAGSAVGGVIGGVFGGGQGSQIGASIGKGIGDYLGRFFGWGAANKETQARHGFANFLEDKLTGMGGLTVYDQKGKNPTKLTNFVEGASTRFNDPHWSDELNKQTKKVQGTFKGLAEGLKEVLGITEDVGGELALMLGENLKFNVDNARHLVQRLGVSFEEMRDKLVEVGLKGDKTWLEITGDIAGVAEAFKPGLAAVGAFAQAFGNLLNSGARGFEAVQAVRDIGVEAAQAGVKNFEQLRQQLLKTYDPKSVDAFFQALKQRGVTSIGQIMQLGNEASGSIVADMQALGVKFTDTGSHMTDGLSANTTSTDENTAALRENTRAQGGSVSDSSGGMDVPASDGEVANAQGGVVHGPTRALMGENGPEAILPLTRRNGKLGVSFLGGSGGAGGGGYVINIDARGAAPGVGKEIRSAIRSSERRLMASVSRSARNRDRRLT